MLLLKAVPGFLTLLMMAASPVAQPFGRGPGTAPRGGGADEQFSRDQELFHFLLDNRHSIRRTVVNMGDGVETVTESDDPAIAASLREHVHRMYARMKESRPIHLRDPLFRELFENADKIEMSLEETEQGIRVRESCSDPRVVKLIQEHARVVSLFLANGRAEVRKNHTLP